MDFNLTSFVFLDLDNTAGVRNCTKPNSTFLALIGRLGLVLFFVMSYYTDIFVTFSASPKLGYCIP